jgi:hypothetical protein
MQLGSVAGDKLDIVTTTRDGVAEPEGELEQPPRWSELDEHDSKLSHRRSTAYHEPAPVTPFCRR